LSNSRLLKRLENSVTLTQSDTTVGFLSQNHTKLSLIKERDISKPFVKVYPNFKSLHVRVPKSHRKMLRHANARTVVVKNEAFRVVKKREHLKFLNKFEWMYSTSANEKAKEYKRDFCEDKADIIVEDITSLHVKRSSTIIKLYKTKIKKLR